MGTKCGACAHPRAADLNAALLAGVPQREVARRYGLSAGTIQRHWQSHMVDAVRARAAMGGDRTGSSSTDEQPPTLDAISGEMLLEQAGRIHVHALALLETLETGMTAGTVGAADVVRALREVRGSLETLGKFFVMVEDRPRKTEQSSRPELDAALVELLRARDVHVAQDPSHWQQYREPLAELGPAT